ncbi:atp synthase subunit delta [Trichoderma arundinaceum]|uniref:Atp synthase subunit delta n=1 Tax=Trichoderma arundinaceum TaxID=490622 RepID=A0A395N775_TRIAR|nr:atp synthase subunit delta [Trichoderma arundinaceum]
MLATSLSSDYTTAEPSLMQQPERDILSVDRAGSNHDMRTSPRRRIHELADDATTNTQRMAHGLHNIEKDHFWVPSEAPYRSQRVDQPQTVGTDNHSTPKPTVEGADNDFVNSTDLGEPPVPQSQTDFDHEQRNGAGTYRSQGSPQKDRGSPSRKQDDAGPRTPRVTEERLEVDNSPEKAIITAKGPQQNMASSDFSTWKQQLRKVGNKPVPMNSPSRKTDTSLVFESQKYTPQSSGSVPHEKGGLPNPTATTRLKTEAEEQASKEYRQMGSTNYGISSNQAEDAVKESKTASNIPSGDSEMPISHHICEWHSRYLGLSTAFDKLKNELDIALEHQASQSAADRESGNTSRQHQHNDDGIEGLTIIVHRRCKEDLVLNTDLREEEFTRLGEQ